MLFRSVTLLSDSSTDIWSNVTKVIQEGTYIYLGKGMYKPTDKTSTHVILRMPDAVDSGYYFTLECFIRAYLGMGVRIAKFYVSGLFDTDKKIKNAIAHCSENTGALESISIKENNLYINKKSEYCACIIKNAIILTSNTDTKKKFVERLSIDFTTAPSDATEVSIVKI